MWRIGDLQVPGPVVLGPMSGYTFRSYREFMQPFGASVVMTEMTSDSAVLNNPSCRPEYLEFGRCPHTGLQLFGSSPETMADAAAEALRINPNIDFIDVNMSCPVEKVMRSGSGSVLMSDPEKCGDIVRSIKRRTDVPVTAKIRLGASLESLSFRDVISELESADVDAVSLHARTAKDRYAGEPRYGLVEGLRKEMGVPLIISGNIYTAEDALHARDVTGADAVMVARGGVGNPWLLTQTDRLLRDGTMLPYPTVSQQVDWCIELARMVFDEKGKDVGVRKMRSIAPRFVTGCRRCREYRLKLATGIDDWDSMVSILEEIRSKKGDLRIMSVGGKACARRRDFDRSFRYGYKYGEQWVFRVDAWKR